MFIVSISISMVDMTSIIYLKNKIKIFNEIKVKIILSSVSGADYF